MISAQPLKKGRSWSSSLFLEWLILSKLVILSKIATKYKADESEIVQFNNIRPDALLAVGSEIIVPDAVINIAPIGANGSVLRGSGGPSYAGYYIRPIAGGRKTQGLHGYNGVDIGAPEGTPVLASASGEVIISRNYGWNGGYGQYVVVQHDNGTQTLYGHLSENIVFEGYHVVRGQVIGLVGNTENLPATICILRFVELKTLSRVSPEHFECFRAKNPLGEV